MSRKLTDEEIKKLSLRQQKDIKRKREKYRRKPATLQNCIVCGKTISYTSYNNHHIKYCSINCRKIIEQKKRDKTRNKNNIYYCLVCDERLIKHSYKNHFSRYCSIQCRQQEYYWRYNKLHEERECHVCEQLFIPQTSQKYCSFQCKIQGEIWNRFYRKSGERYANEYYYIRSEYRKNNPLCKLCNKRYPPDIMELHHIIPFNKSRDDSKENLIWLCPTCHKLADLNYIKI